MRVLYLHISNYASGAKNPSMPLRKRLLFTINALKYKGHYVVIALNIIKLRGIIFKK